MKTGTGTQALSGGASNGINAKVSAGTLQLGKTGNFYAVNDLTIEAGGTVTYLNTNTNQIGGSLTLNGGTINLNGVTESVANLLGTGGTINNGTMKVLTSKNNQEMALAGTGALEIATSQRVDFRVGSTHSGGTIFSNNNGEIWLTGNANGSTTLFNPLGTGTVTAAANVSFKNLGYGYMVTLNNPFQINEGKTLNLNLMDGGAGTHGFTLTNTISGTGTLKISNAKNNLVVLSGASDFEGTVLQTTGTMYAENGSFGTLNISGGTFSPGNAADDIGQITLTSASQSGTTASGKLVLDVANNNGTLQYDTLNFTNADSSFGLADGSLLFNFVGMEIEDETLYNLNFLEGFNLAAGDYSSWLDPSLSKYLLTSNGAGNLMFGNVSTVPEPASWMLLLLGFAGFYRYSRISTKKSVI